MDLDELDIYEQVQKIIEEFNLYGTGVRERLIKHLEAAEQRAEERAYQAAFFDN